MTQIDAVVIDLLGDATWLFGVFLAAFASFVSNLGINLQKLAHIRIAALGSRTSYTKNYYWIIGISLVILGSIADFIALGFAAQSIITPLGSLTLVANVFFAPRLLNEKVDRRDLVATFTIIIGTSLAIAFASKKDVIFKADEMFALYLKPRFVVYFVVVMTAMFAMWVVIQYCDYIVDRHGELSTEYKQMMKYHRFLYASLSGTVGAQNVLFAKCTVELLLGMFSDGNIMFWRWQTYVILLCLGTTIFMQIRWLNAGLQRFDALYIVPVFQSFWILVSVVAGLVFFGEYADMSSLQAGMFPVGLLFAVAGLYVLSQRQVNYQQRAAAPSEATRRSATSVELDALVSPITDVGAGEHRNGDTHYFDVSVGMMGENAPASIGGAAVGRTGAVLTSKQRDIELLKIVNQRDTAHESERSAFLGDSNQLNAEDVIDLNDAELSSVVPNDGERAQPQLAEEGHFQRGGGSLPRHRRSSETPLILNEHGQSLLLDATKDKLKNSDDEL